MDSALLASIIFWEVISLHRLSYIQFFSFGILNHKKNIIFRCVWESAINNIQQYFMSTMSQISNISFCISFFHHWRQYLAIALSKNTVKWTFCFETVGSCVLTIKCTEQTNNNVTVSHVLIYNHSCETCISSMSRKCTLIYNRASFLFPFTTLMYEQFRQMLP